MRSSLKNRDPHETPVNIGRNEGAKLGLIAVVWCWRGCRRGFSTGSRRSARNYLGGVVRRYPGACGLVVEKGGRVLRQFGPVERRRGWGWRTRRGALMDLAWELLEGGEAGGQGSGPGGEESNPRVLDSFGRGPAGGRGSGWGIES